MKKDCLDFIKKDLENSDKLYYDCYDHTRDSEHIGFITFDNEDLEYRFYCLKPSFDFSQCYEIFEFLVDLNSNFRDQSYQQRGVSRFMEGQD